MTKAKRAVLIGNSLTKYNQALFTLLIPYWAPILFTQKDPITALMLTYSLFLTDWVVRPLAAYYWGKLADDKGRSYALQFSLVGIGVCAFLMAGLPYIFGYNHLPYTAIGLIRLIQSFFSAGESTNGIVWILERTPNEQRAWMSSLYDFSSMFGSFIAVLIAVGIGRYSDLSQQWFWLFLLSSALSVYSIAARFAWVDSENSYNPPSSDFSISLIVLLKEYWKPLCGITIVSGFYHSTYQFAFTLLQGYLPLISTISAQNAY